jgi:hypothetical protein
MIKMPPTVVLVRLIVVNLRSGRRVDRREDASSLHYEATELAPNETFEKRP